MSGTVPVTPLMQTQKTLTRHWHWQVVKVIVTAEIDEKITGTGRGLRPSNPVP